MTRWRSPGRVNLIGEHTDYNDGFALPMAIEQGCTATVTRLDEPLLRIRSAQAPDVVHVALDGLAPSTVPGWGGYAAGVVWALQQRGVAVPGLDIHVDGDVPLGAGLSSSAALSCSVIAAMNDLLALQLSRPEWVALARTAENDFVGAPTGGMDQMASVLSEDRHALLCDMRSLDTTSVPFDLTAAGLQLLVTDTQAPHRHADGAYAERRNACEEAAALLGVTKLREVQTRDHAVVLAQLDGAGGSDEVLMRARHILTENDRVLHTVALLQAGELAAIGPLLTASHESMRVDFEITVEEVDVAVRAALGGGALGARMTGGGFGGCVIALVPDALIERVSARIRGAFAEYRFAEPVLFDAVPSPGAHRL
jgi:galactokinase